MAGNETPVSPPVDVSQVKHYGRHHDLAGRESGRVPQWLAINHLFSGLPRL